MGIARYQLITATGNSTPIVVDYLQTPFAVSAALEIQGGTTLSATLQYTLDDPNDAAWTTVWIPAGSAVTASTAVTFGLGGTYPGPIRALRVNVGTLSGGNLRLSVLQGISPFGG